MSVFYAFLSGFFKKDVNTGLQRLQSLLSISNFVQMYMVL